MLRTTMYVTNIIFVSIAAYSCLLYALSNRQPIKTRLVFLPGYGPIAIADETSGICAICYVHVESCGRGKPLQESVGDEMMC
jgi:hypothetical protein